MDLRGLTSLGHPRLQEAPFGGILNDKTRSDSENTWKGVFSQLLMVSAPSPILRGRDLWSWSLKTEAAQRSLSLRMGVGGFLLQFGDSHDQRCLPLRVRVGVVNGKDGGHGVDGPLSQCFYRSYRLISWSQHFQKGKRKMKVRGLRKLKLKSLSYGKLKPNQA